MVASVLYPPSNVLDYGVQFSRCHGTTLLLDTLHVSVGMQPAPQHEKHRQ